MNTSAPVYQSHRFDIFVRFSVVGHRRQTDVSPWNSYPWGIGCENHRVTVNIFTCGGIQVHVYTTMCFYCDLAGLYEY